MNKINYAIVGLGNIGSRHLAHILNNEESNLVAICDIDTSKEAIAKEKNVAFYTDYNEMLNREDITVVSICTPNHLHSSQCISALIKGFHTIVEKPMALSVEECDAMINAELVSGKKIFAVKQNRYNPPVQVLKQAIENEWLGDIFNVQVNCFWNRNEEYYNQSSWRGKKKQDGGCLFTQFSHFVDIMYYLIGDVEVASGVMNNFVHPHIEIEDTGSFILKNKKHNAIVNFNYTTGAYAQNMEGAITIFGTKGTVKIGGQYLNTIEYQNIENNILPELNITFKANDYGTYKGSMSNHDKVIENVNAVLLRGDKMTTTAQDGRVVVSIIESMYDKVSI